MTYSEKLQDPRWQKRRLQILEAANFTCQLCPNNQQTLHVHHLAYTKEPWDAPDSHLICLCADCHEMWPDDLVCAAVKALAIGLLPPDFREALKAIRDGICSGKKESLLETLLKVRDTARDKLYERGWRIKETP